MKRLWQYCFLLVFCHTSLFSDTEAYSPTFLENFRDQILSEQQMVLSKVGLTPPPLTGYVPFQITNNSGYSDTQIYILVITNTFSNIVLFTPNSDGVMVGSYATPPPKTYVNQPGSGTYTLQDFAYTKEDGTIYVLYLPSTINLTSSRIYYSIGQPLDWFIPASGPILVPSQDFSDPTQDGYYTLFDKQEFTMVANNRFVMNPTLVDYYGIPLSFYVGYTDYTQPAPYPQVVQYAGLPPTLSSTTIFNSYQSAVNSLPTTPGAGVQSKWQRLLLSYAPPSGTSGFLRILSPAQGIVTTSTAYTSNPIFPLDYYITNTYTTTNWVTQVINNGSDSAFYQDTTKTLYLDLSTAGPSYGVARGQIDNAGNFKFTVLTGTGNGLTMTLPQPTTSTAFFTSTLSDYAPYYISSGNVTIDTAIWQGVSAGVISGLLPVASTSQSAPFGQGYARTHKLFTTNSHLSSGPWYDFYSGTLISMASGNYQKFYTTPYADYLGTDGTVTVTNIIQAGAAVVANIGNMTGIPIPDPFTDSNLYSVEFGIIPAGVIVTFGTNPNYSLNPQISNLQQIPNVVGSTMYMGVTYTTGNYTGQIWGTHIIPSGPALKPVLPGGVNIVLTGGPGGTLSITPNPPP